MAAWLVLAGMWLLAGWLHAEAGWLAAGTAVTPEASTVEQPVASSYRQDDGGTTVLLGTPASP
eukprot:COSAG01_NODE_38263_length_491_cov_46.742347_1_plen_62_part_10